MDECVVLVMIAKHTTTSQQRNYILQIKLIDTATAKCKTSSLL